MHKAQTFGWGVIVNNPDRFAISRDVLNHPGEGCVPVFFDSEVPAEEYLNYLTRARVEEAPQAEEAEAPQAEEATVRGGRVAPVVLEIREITKQEYADLKAEERKRLRELDDILDAELRTKRQSE